MSHKCSGNFENQAFEPLNRRIALLEGIASEEKAVEQGRTVSYKEAKKANGTVVQLIWTEPALSDLEAVADYIALDNLTAAKGLVQRVFSHLEQLQSRPESGSVVRELPHSPYRPIAEPPGRIFYRLDGTGVQVLHTMRGGMSIRKQRLVSRGRQAS